MSNVDDRIFDFAYVMAMRDATLRGAYTGTRKYLHKVVSARNLVKKHLDLILLGKWKDKTKQLDYDKAFYKVANEVSSIIDGFSFGNAQKLINMTIKYFYISTYRDSSLRENFVNCHCPMDRQLIKAVKEKYGVKLPYNIVWSRIDEDTYQYFEYSIRQLCVNNKNYINSIEFDYYEWNSEEN